MGPRWQFRTITDSSNPFSTNSPTHLAPALKTFEKRARYGNIIYDAANGKNLDRRLDCALRGQWQENNPFVFTTTSFPLALQHALDKASKGEINAYILCIDTWKVQTAEGEKVHFNSAKTVMQTRGMEELRGHHNGEVRDFSDVYLTTSDFYLGSRCRMATLEALINEGIFDLFADQGRYQRKKTPPPKEAERYTRRHGVGLETPMSDLREWRYKTTRDLSSGELGLAAKLASAFTPVRGEVNTELPMHILAHLLAAKSQDANGPNFNNWLLEHSSTNAVTSAMHFGSRDHTLLETNQFLPLLTKLTQRTIVPNSLPTINRENEAFKEHIVKECTAYHNFWSPRASLRADKQKKYWEDLKRSSEALKKRKQAEEGAEELEAAKDDLDNGIEHANEDPAETGEKSVVDGMELGQKIKRARVEEGHNVDGMEEIEVKVKVPEEADLVHVSVAV